MGNPHALRKPLIFQPGRGDFATALPEPPGRIMRGDKPEDLSRVILTRVQEDARQDLAHLVRGADSALRR